MSPRAVGAAVLAALVLLVAAPAAVGADPAQVALRARDAYASPIALGEDSAAAEERLAQTARALRAKGHSVKLAIVAGPVGSPSLRVYAQRLRHALRTPGTVVVTAPGRPVVAVGPRPPADITLDLRRARVGSIADPVERVIRAAERAVGAPPAEGGDDSGTRGLTAILALAVAGGAWAAAWGLRRETRRAAAELAAERARVRLELDVLRARARELASRPEPPPAARAALDRALTCYSDALVQLERSRRPEDVRRALPQLGRGIAAVAEAAQALGEPFDPADPYRGLCAVDPGHGAATGSVLAAGESEPVPACARCVEEAAAGRPPTRRVVPVEGHDVPCVDAPPLAAGAALAAAASAAAVGGPPRDPERNGR